MKNQNLILMAAVSATVFISGAVSAENMNFSFNNPNFGGNPNNGAFLFGLAEAQRTATANDTAAQGGGAQTPGVAGGGNIGGPTIIIPIGNLGPDTPVIPGIGGQQISN